MLAFLFATPWELGFDPHVYRVGRSWVYELPSRPADSDPRYFLVKEELVARREEKRAGRVTRIWGSEKSNPRLT